MTPNPLRRCDLFAEAQGGRPGSWSCAGGVEGTPGGCLRKSTKLVPRTPRDDRVGPLQGALGADQIDRRLVGIDVLDAVALIGKRDRALRQIVGGVLDLLLAHADVGAREQDRLLGGREIVGGLGDSGRGPGGELRGERAERGQRAREHLIARMAHRHRDAIVDLGRRRGAAADVGAVGEERRALAVGPGEQVRVAHLGVPERDDLGLDPVHQRDRLLPGGIGAAGRLAAPSATDLAWSTSFWTVFKTCSSVESQVLALTPFLRNWSDVAQGGLEPHDASRVHRILGDGLHAPAAGDGLLGLHHRLVVGADTALDVLQQGQVSDAHGRLRP